MPVPSLLSLPAARPPMPVRFGARFPERIFLLDFLEKPDPAKPPLTNLEEAVLNEIAQLVLVHKAAVERYQEIPPKYGLPGRIDPQIIELSQIYEAFGAKDSAGLFGKLRDWRRQRQITQAMWKFNDLGYIRFCRSFLQDQLDKTRPAVLPADHVAFYPTVKGLARNTRILPRRIHPEPGQRGFKPQEH